MRASGNQILVPVGFAHGFCTLEPNTEVFYKVSAPYSPEHDRGVSWIDKDIGIDWPVAAADASCRPRTRSCPASPNYPTASPTISNCELVRRRTGIQHRRMAENPQQLGTVR